MPGVCVGAGEGAAIVFSTRSIGGAGSRRVKVRPFFWSGADGGSAITLFRRDGGLAAGNGMKRNEVFRRFGMFAPWG